MPTNEAPSVHSTDGPTPDATTGSRGTAVLLWIAAVCVLGFILAWPLPAGLTLANDALTFRKITHLNDSMVEGLAEHWDSKFFRPVDVFASTLTDAVTREARATMLFQVPALLLFVAAVAIAVRRVVPRSPVAVPLALTWLGLHAATTSSIWSPHAISQTWSAAIGAWLGLVLWRTIERLQAGHAAWRSALVITLLCVIGVLSKETFHGWCAGGLLVLGICFANEFVRRRRPSLFRWSVVALPMLALPMLHLYLRIAHGGFASSFEAESGRYSIALGLNLVTNGAVAIAGYGATVPTHLGVVGTGWIVLVPLVGIGLVYLVMFMPWLAVGLGAGAWGDRPSWKTVGLIALMSFVAVSPTLPTPHISELHLMGPNGGAAVLFALGVLGLWSVVAVDGRRGPVAVAVVAAPLVAIFAIGAFGLTSRALHFRATWRSVDVVWAQIMERLETMPTPAAGDAPLRVFIPDECATGEVYGQYVMSPAQAIGTGLSQEWLAEWMPDRPVEFLLGEIRRPDPQRDLILDCSEVPQRPTW